MAKIKLTVRNVDRLAAPDPSRRQQIYWAESGYTGLGILVSGVSATKTWVCQAKLKSGKTRRLTIGRADVLTIEQAWEDARAKLAEIYRGIDPKVSAAQRKRAAMTVAEVLEDYIKTSSNLAPKTLELHRYTARVHLAPLLSRTLREIGADEVAQRFRAITQDVATRRAAGKIKGGVNVEGRATANNALRLLRVLWNHQAMRDPDVGPNPVGGTFRRQWHRLDRRTRHVATEQLASFYAAARLLSSEIQRDLVIFALFTGMREGEASALRWDEVDLVARMIRIPESRMKAHKPFDLPMSDVVHALLVGRRAYGRDGPYVFPGNGRSGHCEAFQYALRQIGGMTGITVSPHDLRRTFASVAAVTAIPPLALKLMLSHSVGSDVTFGYTQLSTADLRAALQKVADRMKELCGIEKPAGVTTMGERA
jgi:integrase